MVTRREDGGFAQQQRLIAALSEPSRFDGGVARVAIVETHVSWVLLTGRHAYKIKKAIALPFLDGRALATRRAWCDEELRLNRRTAPALYLDVVPIAGSVDAPVVGGAGEAIEYAVRMREFPRDALLCDELARGEVTPRDIDSLALAIADFHRRIACADAASTFGTPDEILRFAVDNFATIGAGFGAPDEAAALDRLKRWTHAEFATHEKDFRRRRNGGFIRECHGDLHLANIARIDGRVTVFDCIEYNDHFRWIDVMSEVAFTVMDLDDRGSPALAWRLLNGYLEASGDYAGVAVLRFYLVYRAMVRAKVDCMRAAQLPEGSARAEHVADCRGYVALAGRFAASPMPVLIATHGVSGSGKTTMTQQLLEAIGGIRVRTDVERRRLADAASGFAGGPQDRYGDAATEATYRRVAELAQTVLAAGWPVIVDAACLAAWQRQLLREVAAAAGAPFVLLAFAAPTALLRERIANRRREARDASEADEAVLEMQLQTLEPLSDDERRCAIVAAGDATGPATIASLVESLRHLPPGPVPRGTPGTARTPGSGSPTHG